MPTKNRTEWLLFAAVFWLLGAFYSGGGWNQNARFAQVRAMAEENRPEIDRFLVYKPDSGEKLERFGIVTGSIPISEGVSEGQSPFMVHLAWRGPDGRLRPIEAESNGGGGTGSRLVALEAVAASGDVSYSGGHFYPNKPPGASLAGLPAYAALLGIERLMGWNPDDWRVLTVNAWLVTALSAGLVSALGAVILFRVAGRFVGRRAALGVSLACFLGTLLFPYGTMLFDHNFVATALIGSFALLLKAREGPGGAPCRKLAAAAGLLAGSAVLCNYLAGPVLAMLLLYGGRRRWAAFLAGTAAPLLALAWYHQVCFGSPFAVCNTSQNPLFTEQFATQNTMILGMFGVPRFDVALMLLASPFRGLFFMSPILILAAWGLWRWGRRGHGREALLCAAVFAFFYTTNVLFSGWHGGYGVGPRYLIPAVPFLALGLVGVWREFPRLCLGTACVSIFIQAALTAADPMSPVGTGSVARAGDRPDWRYSPLTEYALPLLATGRAGPLLEAMGEDYLEQQVKGLEAGGRDPRDFAGQLAWLGEEIGRATRQGEVFPFPLAAFPGPVSANPMSIYEGDYFQLSEPHTSRAEWSAFNVGEFLFPGSRWSLAVVWGVAAMLLLAAGRADRRTVEPVGDASLLRPARVFAPGDGEKEPQDDMRRQHPGAERFRA